MSRKPTPPNRKKVAAKKPKKPAARKPAAAVEAAPPALSTDSAPQPAADSPGGYVVLGPGDPAPWFAQRSGANPNYVFDTAAGRWLVLCFFGSAGDPGSRAALDAVAVNRAIFDDDHASFFGVSLDPKDEAQGRVAESMPGLRFFWDFDGAIARAYGAVPQQAAPGKGPVAMRRFWAIVDPTLRIRRILPFRPDGSEIGELFACLRALPKPGRHAGFDVPPPVLILPDVFEAAFCRHLIGLYEANGGAESGFMREVEGKTITVSDHKHKRRRDYVIEDRDLIRQTQMRIHRRVVPEILKAHQFKVTRMKRYLVACYAAKESGHFRAHRDNTTKGTAHRRFAVSVNLNDDFEGGEIGFPEYGPGGFKLPAGTACVFSCSLLHRVSPMTRGRRFAFLPFLYDDEAAKIREANNRFLGDGVGAYKAG